MYFFSTKAFLISAIVIAKIIYLGFLASYTSGSFRSSIVSYIASYLSLDLVLDIELVLDLGLGSLSILFIVEY